MDRDEIKALLRAQGLTFKGAKKRHTVGEDQDKILAVVGQWKDPISPRHGETMVYTAYWELYDERKK